jgi:UPF0755 protein
MSRKNYLEQLKENLRDRGEEARTVRKTVFIILLSLTLLIIIGGFSSYLYINSALQPMDPGNEETTRVEIPMGSSTSNIAEILEENDIIKNATIFNLYTKFTSSDNFQAGEYAFSPSMSMDEIIESLENGQVSAVHTVTIPEGYTVEQIGETFADTLDFTKDDFLETVNDSDYIEQLIEEYPDILSEEILDAEIRQPLEGYMFASTYELYEEEPSIESIVEMMLERTESVVSPYFEEIEEKGLTVHEALTFASLVENEARTEEQRREISGVFYNRLEEGMRLQTDPTVLYALGEHKDRVLYDDLEIESPYNTYRIEALPVGPISNFHENSLDAVLYPEESDYLYFLHDGEGEIYYSDSYEEHLDNREKYIQSERDEDE